MVFLTCILHQLCITFIQAEIKHFLDSMYNKLLNGTQECNATRNSQSIRYQQDSDINLHSLRNCRTMVGTNHEFISITRHSRKDDDYILRRLDTTNKYMRYPSIRVQVDFNMKGCSSF